jgi:hypothetical protein
MADRDCESLKRRRAKNADPGPDEFAESLCREIRLEMAGKQKSARQAVIREQTLALELANQSWLTFVLDGKER